MTDDNQESYTRESINQSNDGYTTAGAIQIRLDTAPMIDNLEAFFRGTRVIGYKENEDGSIVPLLGPSGKAKMNDEGVQSILTWLTPLFSPHTVQGNTTEEEYIDFLIRLETDLRDYIMTNLHNWNIKIEDFNGIVDMIINTGTMFFSRTIDNKERESYAPTMKTVERTGSDSPKKGILGFKI